MTGEVRMSVGKQLATAAIFQSLANLQRHSNNMQKKSEGEEIIKMYKQINLLVKNESYIKTQSVTEIEKLKPTFLLQTK